MPKRLISIRHRPSFTTYLWQNAKISLAVAERAELMLNLVLLLLSMGFGIAGGLGIPEIVKKLEPWPWPFVLGFIIFVVIQFGIVTPFRMWRKSVWVANIEKMLEELFDYHDRGVSLLNEHFNALRQNPNLQNDPKLLKMFLDNWYQEYEKWVEETANHIQKLSPLEGRRFKNIVVFCPTFNDGLDKLHDKYRSMILKRLEKIDAIIERHQPSLLPE